MNINEIVEIKTLPVLLEQLDKLGEYIDSQLADVGKLMKINKLLKTKEQR